MMIMTIIVKLVANRCHSTLSCLLSKFFAIISSKKMLMLMIGGDGGGGGDLLVVRNFATHRKSNPYFVSDYYEIRNF